MAASKASRKSASAPVEATVRAAMTTPSRAHSADTVPPTWCPGCCKFIRWGVEHSCKDAPSSPVSLRAHELLASAAQRVSRTLASAAVAPSIIRPPAPPALSLRSPSDKQSPSLPAAPVSGSPRVRVIITPTVPPSPARRAVTGATVPPISDSLRRRVDSVARSFRPPSFFRFQSAASSSSASNSIEHDSFTSDSGFDSTQSSPIHGSAVLVTTPASPPRTESCPPLDDRHSKRPRHTPHGPSVEVGATAPVSIQRPTPVPDPGVAMQRADSESKRAAASNKRKADSGFPLMSASACSIERAVAPSPLPEAWTVNELAYVQRCLNVIVPVRAAVDYVLTTLCPRERALTPIESMLRSISDPTIALPPSGYTLILRFVPVFDSGRKQSTRSARILSEFVRLTGLMKRSIRLNKSVSLHLVATEFEGILDAGGICHIQLEVGSQDHVILALRNCLLGPRNPVSTDSIKPRPACVFVIDVPILDTATAALIRGDIIQPDFNRLRRKLHQISSEFDSDSVLNASVLSELFHISALCICMDERKDANGAIAAGSPVRRTGSLLKGPKESRKRSHSPSSIPDSKQPPTSKPKLSAPPTGGAVASVEYDNKSASAPAKAAASAPLTLPRARSTARASAAAGGARAGDSKSDSAAAAGGDAPTVDVSNAVFATTPASQHAVITGKPPPPSFANGRIPTASALIIGGCGNDPNASLADDSRSLASGITADVGIVNALCRQSGITVFDTFQSAAGPHVLSEIRKLFKHCGKRLADANVPSLPPYPPRGHALLYFSGHGSKERKGAWIFANGEFISAAQVLEAWNESVDSAESRLVIIIDACYAGFWVEAINSKTCPYSNILILVSAGKKETAGQPSGDGSAFTILLAQANKQLENATVPKLENQTPHCASLFPIAIPPSLIHYSPLGRVPLPFLLTWNGAKIYNYTITELRRRRSNQSSIAAAAAAATAAASTIPPRPAAKPVSKLQSQKSADRVAARKAAAVAAAAVTGTNLASVIDSKGAEAAPLPAAVPATGRASFDPSTCTIPGGENEDLPDLSNHNITIEVLVDSDVSHPPFSSSNSSTSSSSSSSAAAAAASSSASVDSSLDWTPPELTPTDPSSQIGEPGIRA